MGVRTLLGYLVGSRAAILMLAAHPHAWLVGLVFVLSAGFAREYDGADLLHEPEHLAIPLAASLGSSFILFGLLYLPSRIARAEGPPFFAAYRAFLGLFWMTAPLAWLYAIPYERILDPVSAAYANVYTLALVSVWRVGLMMRVGVVLIGLPRWAAIFRVLAYADTLALIAIHYLPFPIVNFMGGMRLGEAESIPQSAALIVGFYGGCSFVVWWLLVFVSGNRIAWALPWREPAPPAAAISRPLQFLAAASLAVWAPILPFTQPEQRIRFRVETAFREGRYRDMILDLSSHEPSDYPPQWGPPPAFLKGDSMAKVLDVWDEILTTDTAPWVRQRYLERFNSYVETYRYNMDEERIARLLNQLPEGEALLQKWAADERMHWQLGKISPHLRDELRKRIGI